jgi:hypothetical protein
MSEDKTCDKCFYCREMKFRQDKVVTGICHRYPPVAAENRHFYFPVVYGDSWCGEWRERE